MENNDYGLLYDAAVAWKELTEYYYVFTFGYKQQLYTIHLSFPSEKVPHLAASEIVINNFMVSGLASRSITDNAGWHTQNTQIFYSAILTYEKLYGILFLIKIEII
ncbi:PBECR4 domain-containing protein [Anaerostipes amylophilus]|jgi:hypothetical protein|uniref:PBECR4 domain-containing protein n=1 Tax=Anaerostipes amylophilus TaxID=2981779 RepID=UPI0006DC5A3D|nr:hypothetical protein [Anaerostipes amylophilus]MCU6782130.1 hypothetical protein [Anaerostipes amylophilus]